jgi:hypothetical protein
LRHGGVANAVDPALGLDVDPHPRPERARNVRAAVGRAVVDDDQLDPVVGLSQSALDRLAQVALAVVDGD